MAQGIFNIALRFKDPQFFFVTISESFKTFSILHLWNKFSGKRKLEYRFLVETAKIENTSFLFKTALSEANVKTNRMATTKWTYHKEWSFEFCQ